ncbi:probable phenylalanine--tRNA ligase, mitochondrial [Anabrus simplex]|uniref:probable phenylalanine--tRNA ligase, mitochondrial n=1 Tax=Anabrus simplex TaxID=316456 RepID=UPI0034DD7CE5
MFMKHIRIAINNPLVRYGSTAHLNRQGDLHIDINGCRYQRDEWTNISPKVLSHFGRNLHLQKNHPLSLIRQRIVNYFYKRFVGRTGNAIFSVYDSLNPIVTVKQNFDSLLIPLDHPSRKKTDCYYVNSDYLLRAHTTAHQAELIGMGLNNFLIVGDVYRRDEIDSKHYPVFHQLDAVRLCTKQEIFRDVPDDEGLKIFENTGRRTDNKQEVHTLEATKIMEHELKRTLTGLAQALFGKHMEYRWVETYFPFTHPSWELEVYHKEKWLEVLGCGIMEHKILQTAGAIERMGWAFGLGLERLAMCLYDIPDIRLFWSTDPGFLSQFNVSDPNTPVKYKPVSIYPQCKNDISFWLPKDHPYSPNDFYDLVRCIGGDLVEQICLVDEFTHPKRQETSHCYRIVYRHMEKTLTQEEVNLVHKEIEKAATENLHVKIR